MKAVGSIRVNSCLLQHKFELVSNHVPMLAAAQIVGAHQHEEYRRGQAGGQQAALESPAEILNAITADGEVERVEVTKRLAPDGLAPWLRDRCHTARKA